MTDADEATVGGNDATMNEASKGVEGEVEGTVFGTLGFSIAFLQVPCAED